MRLQSRHWPGLPSCEGSTGAARFTSRWLTHIAADRGFSSLPHGLISIGQTIFFFYKHYSSAILSPFLNDLLFSSLHSLYPHT